MIGTQSSHIIGTIELSALISCRFNASLHKNGATANESKVSPAAFSLTDDSIGEIKAKAFDEAAIEWNAVSEDQRITAINFVPEMRNSGRTVDKSTRDNTDGCIGYVKRVSASYTENYSVSGSIDYVKPFNRDEISDVQTYFKLVTISVTSPCFSYPVRLSFIFTIYSH